MLITELDYRNLNDLCDETQERIFENLNDCLYDTLRDYFIDYEGLYQMNSRNGSVKCIFDYSIYMKNPLSRHLSLKGRTNNFFGTLGEMFWVMSGDSMISPLLEFFVPRAKNYSDDGKTWNAAYGDRLWEYEQFSHIVNMFKEDGVFTRRATASIFIPQRDAYYYYHDFYDSKTMLDIPCNQWLNFYAIPKNGEIYLNLKVLQRSGDIIYGTTNINIPEFSLIHEMILHAVRTLYPNLNVKLGYYKHEVTNLHLYETLEKQFENIVKDENKTENEKRVNNGNDYLLAKFPPFDKKELTSFDRIRTFFIEIVDVFEFAITNKSQNYESVSERVDSIFDSYEVEKEDNSLYAYAKLCSMYIIGKNRELEHNPQKLNVGDLLSELKITKANRASGLLQAVEFNKFRNFEYSIKG